MATLWRFCVPFESGQSWNALHFVIVVKGGMGKVKEGQAQKFKVTEWCDELRGNDESARTSAHHESVCFSQQRWSAVQDQRLEHDLRRLLEHTREEGIRFALFTLKDMLPAAVTDRVDAGGRDITNLTGHSSDRMVRQVYDRRKKKAAKATS
jgi:hypothetical protein